MGTLHQNDNCSIIGGINWWKYKAAHEFCIIFNIYEILEIECLIFQSWRGRSRKELKNYFSVLWCYYSLQYFKRNISGSVRVIVFWISFWACLKFNCLLFRGYLFFNEHHVYILSSTLYLEWKTWREWLPVFFCYDELFFLFWNNWKQSIYEWKCGINQMKKHMKNSALYEERSHRMSHYTPEDIHSKTLKTKHSKVQEWC